MSLADIARDAVAAAYEEWKRRWGPRPPEPPRPTPPQPPPDYARRDPGDRPK